MKFDHPQRTAWRILAVGVITGAFLVPRIWAGENSCNACHEAITGVRYLEHNFEDWKHSVHAKAGIGCQACHGGNPEAEDKIGAHKGVKPSTDPTSPLSFRNIPETCGACHEAEFKAFQRSVHYKALEKSGRGPNCVTCHGSMANHILAPRDLDQTCTLCHKKPMEASSALLTITHTGASIKRLERALEQARLHKIDVSRQSQQLKSLQGEFEAAHQDWHAFDISSVIKNAHSITQRVTNAVNEIQLKDKQQKP